jgi:hypothetical protein
MWKRNPDLLFDPRLPADWDSRSGGGCGRLYGTERRFLAQRIGHSRRVYRGKADLRGIALRFPRTHPHNEHNGGRLNTRSWLGRNWLIIDTGG